MIDEEILLSALKQLNISYRNEELSKTMRYLGLLYEFNKKFNIVGTKEKKDILVRHLLDCLSILKYFKCSHIGKNQALKILDIGTGAGLPGIPLAIFLKKMTIHLLDKKEKVIKFLKYASIELNLDNIEILSGEAENFAHNICYRENFDIVLSRALGKFGAVCELMLPFCKIGGKTILYKSKKVFKEINENNNAILLLGGEMAQLFELEVPYLQEFRTLLIIDKIKSTLYKYPRKYAKIIKEPLT
ncbi:MAG: 16S rRNA (guanine(527)-N(7))-methyltransferase RsmG [Actinobacteria bacterium]|nr:16S rRNA (guanine(527)-N(7))-methyltransferase RsmG [Actinomycetota bacterium]